MSAVRKSSSERAVDPARLASGRWCHRAEKTLGEGDIAGSYSANRIGMGQPVRKPFAFEGTLWICVGTGPYGDGLRYAEAFRLVHPMTFKGTPVTYREKTADGDAARADPEGFYHGMSVRLAGRDFVLCGPPVTFVPGETPQGELF